MDYAEMQAQAASMIGEFGQAITIVRQSGSIDPVTGVETGAGSTDTVTVGVLLTYPDAMIDGTRILASDRRLYVPGSVDISTSDTVTVDGEPWSIQEIRTTKPAGTAVLQEVRVRR